MIARMRFAGTWTSRASRFLLMPRSASVSLSISPGCTGGSLVVTFRNIDVIGMSLLTFDHLAPHPFPYKINPGEFVDHVPFEVCASDDPRPARLRGGPRAR